MANVLAKQIILDGNRNFVVKLTGVLDTDDVNLSPAIRLSDCLTNQINRTIIGFRVDHIEYSISSGLEVQVLWNASVPQMIAPLAGRGRFGVGSYEGVPPANDTAAGFDGAINLQTTGFNKINPAGLGNPRTYSLTFELVKLYS